MKNKKATYILIVAVIAVWGIIIYRLLLAAGSDDDPVPVRMQSKVPYESLDEYTLKDTFTLALNYRDPFLGKHAPVADVQPDMSKKPVAMPLNTPMKPVINWEPIQYTGYIVNPSGKRVVAIMTIDGKEYMLSDGQTVAGVKLIKNYKDSIKVSYQNKTKFIKIQ